MIGNDKELTEAYEQESMEDKLDNAESIMEKYHKEIDEYDNRYQEEMNALTFLRIAVEESVEQAVAQFESAIIDIYGGD